MKVERLWYELSPYAYSGVGVATALYTPGSLLLKASGLVLFVAAMTIIGLRFAYRRDLAQRVHVPIDQSKYVAPITQDLFYDGPPK